VVFDSFINIEPLCCIADPFGRWIRMAAWLLTGLEWSIDTRTKGADGYCTAYPDIDIRRIQESADGLLQIVWVPGFFFRCQSYQPDITLATMFLSISVSHNFHIWICSALAQFFTLTRCDQDRVIASEASSFNPIWWAWRPLVAPVTKPPAGRPPCLCWIMQLGWSRCQSCVSHAHFMAPGPVFCWKVPQWFGAKTSSRRDRVEWVTHYHVVICDTLWMVTLGQIQIWMFFDFCFVHPLCLGGCDLRQLRALTLWWVPQDSFSMFFSDSLSRLPGMIRGQLRKKTFRWQSATIIDIIKWECRNMWKNRGGNNFPNMPCVALVGLKSGLAWLCSCLKFRNVAKERWCIGAAPCNW